MHKDKTQEFDASQQKQQHQAKPSKPKPQQPQPPQPQRSSEAVEAFSVPAAAAPLPGEDRSSPVFFANLDRIAEWYARENAQMTQRIADLARAIPQDFELQKKQKELDEATLDMERAQRALEKLMKKAHRTPGDELTLREYVQKYTDWKTEVQRHLEIVLEMQREQEALRQLLHNGEAMLALLASVKQRLTTMQATFVAVSQQLVPLMQAIPGTIGAVPDGTAADPNTFTDTELAFADQLHMLLEWKKAYAQAQQLVQQHKNL